MNNEAIFLQKAQEWRRISALNRRYGINSLSIEGNIEGYRVAAESNILSPVPFADNIVIRDIETTIRTGKGLVSSASEIPDILEAERQRELAEYTNRIKADEEKRRAKKVAEEAELKRHKREALERELGVKLG